jgi:ParB-like chromosome segregation protein Spo0J
MRRKAPPSTVEAGFEPAPLRIAMTDIQPLKLVSDSVRNTPKYTQIATSIREVGIVELPVVAHDPGEP